MEVQLTDFENAAFTVFIVLITRVVLAFDLALYIPLSKVDENMSRAQEIDAARRNKFFFRKYLAPLDIPDCGHGDPLHSHPAGSAASENEDGVNVGNGRTSPSSPDTEPSLKKSRSALYLGEAGHPPVDVQMDEEDAYEEMTMDEIFNGKAGYYPGLLPLVYAYLDYINCDPLTYSRVNEYLQFISLRAKGRLKTTARWMRDFVTSHPGYKNDSVVPQDVAFDLMMAAKAVGEGAKTAPELLGNARVAPINPAEAYGSVLKGRLSETERSALLSKYSSRALLSRGECTPRGKARTQSLGKVPGSHAHNTATSGATKGSL